LERSDDSLEHRFRRCVGSFTTGVTVVTVQRGGHTAGMTLNAFTSVSLDPLLILVSLARKTRTLDLLEGSGRFAVSILHSDQHDVALDFAVNGASFPEQHTLLDDEGFVTVRDALAVIRCRVHATVPAGDHELVIGSVVDFEAGDGEPLVFHRGWFARLGNSIHYR
jgi:flavin reductase (DIM6/NTAB) family NADH-FMN oxidoreductase RutF